jgi:hypothetical protein
MPEVQEVKGSLHFEGEASQGHLIIKKPRRRSERLEEISVLVASKLNLGRLENISILQICIKFVSLDSSDQSKEGIRTKRLK